MTDAERDQIRLILDDLLDRADTDIQTDMAALFGRHAARGLLQSSATIKVGAREVEQRLSALVENAVAQVKFVALSSDAFTLMSEAIEQFLTKVGRHYEKITRMANGASGGVTSRAAQTMFAEGDTRVRRQLELHRFAFTQSGRPATLEQAGAQAGISGRRRDKGGRPPAEFWDDLWSHIAASLYGGDLVPKNQADIEKAMAEWIEGRGRSAAPSTIRARARRLWDRLAKLDA